VRTGVGWVAAGALALLGAAAWAVARPAVEPGGARATVSLLETLGGADTAGWARALESRPFVFPADHAAHPRFRAEWWYLTGNLDAADDRRFGFQLTFFRRALSPDPPASASGWATSQVYMAHLALTDVAGGRFHAFERFSRAAVGLAGATAEPFRVWLDDWELRGPGARDADASGDPVWPMTLEAGEGGTGVELTLIPRKGIVLQGEDGLSVKGPEPGNASHYYSFPRLDARGVVRVEGREIAVSGLAWLDREWSTSALPPGVVGWDWLALQLDDGRDLMLYRLRRADGEADPRSEGVLVGAAGETRRLGASDFGLEVTGGWTSPLDGARYPSGWRVRVPAEDLDLTVTPVLEGQELDLSVRYWEGAVDVGGAGGGGPLGRGYAELTGYAGGDTRAGRRSAPVGGR
jgi:predicted secreted hydrolase